FSITCFIKCLRYKISTQYSNEDLGVNFLYLVSGATLAGGINRNSFQTALVTIDITNQCSKPSYYNYQTHLYKPIIDDAKLSCEIILLEILDQLKIINSPDKEKILPIGFNLEYSHLSKLIDSNSSIILHNGNFSGTSKQMEYAILLELLNNIMPILEETDFTLHICIDSDLETNRTLTYIPAVSHIFVDLKHIIEGLIQHLLGNYNLCWSDICWIKDNLELQLQKPILKNYTQTEINNFKNILTTIFHILFDQGLVTTFRTSYNEAFNRKILKYLDKRIDYWVSYCIRHALVIIDQNNGLDTMISKVYMVAELVSYRSKMIDQIHENIFWPSFGNLLIDFGIIEQIIDKQYVPKEQWSDLEKETLVLLAVSKIFGFKEFRDGQKESIIAYLNGNDTFVSMKTGGGKTLCYALLAICFEGLTIVFSSLKVLMKDQK
ncbi:8543_t:CDS:2, partial [Diversispora eburnea]